VALNNNFTFNVGARYDKNDGKDSDGKTVAKDANVSPRLGFTWDPKGDGEWMVNAGYAKYVMAIAGSIADSTAIGGQPGTIDFSYMGPQINPVSGAATLVDSAAALETLFEWFHANVDLDHFGDSEYLLGDPSIPGATAQIKDSLNSTNATEWTIGATKRFGTRAMVRLDFVNREFGDFYALQKDTTTGQITTPNGTFDRGYYINDNKNLERKYQGIQFQFSYRPWDVLSIGGNYTYFTLKGNVESENTVSSRHLRRQHLQVLPKSWAYLATCSPTSATRRACRWCSTSSTPSTTLCQWYAANYRARAAPSGRSTWCRVACTSQHLRLRNPPTTAATARPRRVPRATTQTTSPSTTRSRSAWSTNIQFFVEPGSATSSARRPGYRGTIAWSPPCTLRTANGLELQPVHRHPYRVPAGQHGGAVHRTACELAARADVRPSGLLPGVSDAADVHAVRRSALLARLSLTKHEPRPQGRGFCSARRWFLGTRRGVGYELASPHSSLASSSLRASLQTSHSAVSSFLERAEPSNWSGEGG
jgi:hypothetical protein